MVSITNTARSQTTRNLGCGQVAVYWAQPEGTRAHRPTQNKSRYDDDRFWAATEPRWLLASSPTRIRAETLASGATKRQLDLETSSILGRDMTLRRRLRAALPSRFSTSSSPLRRCGAPPPPGHCAFGAVWISFLLPSPPLFTWFLPSLLSSAGARSLPVCWCCSVALWLAALALRDGPNWPLRATSRTSGAAGPLAGRRPSEWRPDLARLASSDRAQRVAAAARES